MDFIRNLFTLFQRLQDIVRDGQRQGDIPGMAMGLMRELRGGAAEDQAEGDGPAVYRGKVAQADKATPEAASRATARNKAARDTDLPTPAVYHSPEGASAKPEFEPARAPARNADEVDKDVPAPAAAPFTRDQYEFEPASAPPAPESEPEFEPASATQSESAPTADAPGTAAINWDEDVEEPQAAEPETPQPAPPPPAPAPSPAPAPVVSADTAPAPVTGEQGPSEQTPAKKEEDDDWFDLEDWQGTALKVAGVGAAAAATAAGAMAIKDRFFDDEDEEAPSEKSALPLLGGDEPTAEPAASPAPTPAEADSGGEDEDDEGGKGWVAAAAVAAPAVAAVLPKAGDPEDTERDADEGDEAEAPSDDREEARDDAPSPAPRRPHPVEIIPADPRNPATQPASQSLASPGIRLYGAMDAGMYAEFTEMLAEQAPGGPIVIALTTMEGDPEIARSMADDIRLLRDRGRREIIFLGKTAIHGAGVLFMAAFPVSHRYLTRATKLMITENKRAQPMELAGGSLRSVASQLEHAQREIQREIEQEDEDYRAISEGSNVSVQELREKAPNDWYITASEAKAMGLIAEVV
ncbi:ATP-dependent Clp protease proteolytic subunit [Citromicrobium sp. JLT1363]|uniref:ATP-dependent Clp protease proteolytic subunit n=1 Tax=Citromicrobium sp. JLT1363 TaxID=517722 RepID=UPI000225EA3A|nr:ATP-dependent Clp protease proteolytic subunit [Citromicrobium sp. JLT1363]